MKTLSVRQPWAYLLCSGIKDIENRTWKLPEKYKGERVLIHASQSANKGNVKDKLPALYWESLSHKEQDSLIIDTAQRSAIIGSVRFVDCVINHPSIWAERAEKDSWHEYIHGEYQVINPIFNWVVADPILFDKPILNVKGKLGFWDYDLPEEYETILNKALGL